MTHSRGFFWLFEGIADLITEVMQTVFLFLLKPFVSLSKKMAETLKSRLIQFSFFMIMILVYLQHTGISDSILQVLPLPSIVRYVFFDLLGCVFMAIIVVCSIKGPLQRMRTNAFLTLIWAGMCVFFLASALITSLDWAGVTLIFAFVFPCLYFVWNNRGDYAQLFSLFMKGVFPFHILFFIGSMLFSPIGSGQYRGLFTNANSLGQYLTLMFPLFLFEYGSVMHEKRLRTKIKPLIGLGTTVAFILFSASRTAILSNLIVFAVWLIAKFLFEQKENGVQAIIRTVMMRLLPLVLAIALSLPVSFGLIKGATTVVYTTLSHFNLLPEEYAYLDPTLGNQLDVLARRMETDGKDADQLSTHRTLIWKAFSSRILPFGHERGKIYVHEYGVAGTAHNSIIQIAYDSGMGTVLFYFAINAYTGFRAVLYYLRRRKTDSHALFPLLMMPGYLATSLLASCYAPFAYGVALAYWLVQAPLFEKKLTSGEYSGKR